MSETILLIAGAAGFLLVGAGIGFWIANMRAGDQLAKTEELQQKFDTYRRDVTEHFGRTAEHFQAIGKQYRDLYDHLASGADSFCDADAIEEKIVYEPAIGVSTAATVAEKESTDEIEATSPRDYADGDHPDDEEDAESTSAATADDEPETERLAAATEAGKEDAEKKVDDLKPEVKSDADEEPSQPTLH